MKKIKLKGTHLMLDCLNCDKATLSNKEAIANFLNQLPGTLQMKKLMEPITIGFQGGNTWDKGGFSGFVVIAESHVSIHTFPDYGYASIDVYSCMPFDKKKAVRYIKDYFQCKKAQVQNAKRYVELIREKYLKKNK